MTPDHQTGPTSLGHMPDDKWAFDDSVTQVFDDMLQRSIPAYVSMRELVEYFAASHIGSRPGGYNHVLDIGCSRGAAVAPLVAVYKQAAFTLVDISEPMLEAARARFKGNGQVVVKRFDLRTGFPVYPDTTTLVLSVLTLQFVPIEHRLRIVRDAYASLCAGGMMILVEKVIGASAELDQTFVDRYYHHKRAMGYTQEEIDRKRLALEGVMVPLPARWNEEMLKIAGFSAVDCFWRWANFAGWLAIK